MIIVMMEEKPRERRRRAPEKHLKFFYWKVSTMKRSKALMSKLLRGQIYSSIDQAIKKFICSSLLVLVLADVKLKHFEGQSKRMGKYFV